MMTKIRLPMMFDARVGKKEAVQRVHLAREFSVDIPEISTSESEIVFRAFSHGPVPFVADRFSRRSPLIFGRGTEQFLIREYNGRIYRRMDERYAEAFPDPGHEHEGGVSRPIREHYEFLLKIARELRGVKTWPPHTLYTHPPEDKLFDDFVGKFSLLNQDDIAEAEEMHVRRLGELLSIDGEIWAVTPPPCLSVQLEQGKFTDIADIATIRLGIMPDSFDKYLSRRYFSVHQHEEAKEYAEALKTIFAWGKLGVRNLIAAHQAESSPYLDFDGVEDMAMRLSTGLAFSCALQKDKAPSPGGVVERSYMRAKTMNMMLGRMDDLTGELPALVEAWMASGRPTNFCYLGDRGGQKMRQSIMEFQMSEIDSQMPIRLGDLSGRFGM